MKKLIVYVSVHHNNTKKVAERMAAVLGADCLAAKDVDHALLLEYDVIGLGSGIFFGRHHNRLIQLVKEAAVLKGKKVFVFSTAGFEKIAFHNHLKRLLDNIGAEIIGEFICSGWDTYGPFKLVGGIKKNRPNNHDLERAVQFAEELKKGI